jgi:hypothetical protein
MDTEEFLPRLALAGGLVAAIVIYRRLRSDGEVVSTPARETSPMPKVAEAGGTIAKQGQSLVEGVLDNIADQALKELKVVLKDGLKRLEKTVDAL